MKIFKLNLLIPLWRTMLVLLGVCSLGFTASAQQCGTPSPTAQEYRHIRDHIANIVVPRNFGTQQIPIQAHIVRLDNGTGGLTLTELNEGIARLNHYFHLVGIEFFIAGVNYIDDSDHYDLEDPVASFDTQIDAMAVGNTSTTAVNVYFVNTLGTYGTGKSSFPEDNVQKNRITMKNFEVTNVRTFVHEFGHYFSLLHTFETSHGTEHVTRTGSNANCSTKGDLLCDTEAEPTPYTATWGYNTSTCVYTGTDTDPLSVSYTPQTDNLMSYYRQCRHTFTAGQMNKMQQGLIERQDHTVYNLNHAPTAVAVPTNLTATLNGGAIDLSWTDVANNELGYLIERSLSPTQGFQALDLGGVGENGTTFTDNTIDPLMIYYYRVKPSNGDPDVYTTVASISLSTCDGKYKLPFPESTAFRCSRSTGHGAGYSNNAYDFAHSNAGTSFAGVNVVAARDGTVRRIKSNSNIGGNNSAYANDANYVIIDHGDGEESLYLHLEYQSVTVNVGDCVKQGDIIGQVGNTGYSTAPHLHFQVQSSAGWTWWKQSIAACFSDFPTSDGMPQNGNQCVSGALAIAINEDVSLYGGDWNNPRSGIDVKFETSSTNLTSSAVGNLFINGLSINTSNISGWTNNGGGKYAFQLDLSNNIFPNERDDKEISFRLNDGSTSIPAKGKIYFIPPFHTSFDDVSAGDNFTTSIEEGVSYGLFKGKSTGFDPEGNLTRAEAAKVISAAAVKLGVISGFDASIANGSFSDVSKCSWAFPYIQTLRNEGFIDAVANYRPNDPVTIGEFCKMVVNALNLNNSNNTISDLVNYQPYTLTVTPNDALKPYVEQVHETVFFNETTNGEFFAEISMIFSTLYNGATTTSVTTTDPITRADMAKFLTNIYEAKYRELIGGTPPAGRGVQGSISNSNTLPTDLTNTTIIGTKLGLSPITSGNSPAGMPTSYTMYDNQTLPLTYPSNVDQAGNPLIFYWTINNGGLNTVPQYTDYRGVEFTPPTVASPTTYYVYFWTGNTKGKVQESVIEITVNPASMNTAVDWTIQNVSITPLQVEIGSTFTVDYTIANIGGVAAGIGCDVNMYLSTDTIFDSSDMLLQSNPISPLAANSTQIVSTTGTIAANTALGTYYVILVADDGNLSAESNEFNNNSITQINVSPNCGGSSVVSSYSISTDPNDAHTVTFNNTSTGATSYWWDFGDGTTSTDMNPVHTFNSVQNYYVCLTAIAANGCSETYCFSQSITAHLEVDNPNDTVVYEKGKTHLIQWRDNIAHTLSVRLYKGNAYVGELAAAVAASDSTLAWTVPTTLASGGDYRILITSNVDGSLVDYSDYFWIDDSLSTTIRVVSPCVTDVWQMGECYHILWLDSIYSNVEIGLYKGAAYVGPITASTASDGHYEWCVQSGLTPGSDYRIRVYSTQSGMGGTHTAYSAYFTISENQYVQITEPVCPRIARAGFSHTINWVDNIPGDVILRLYKGAAFIGNIVATTDSDGQYHWNVPAGLAAGSDYRILIQSIADGNVLDYSDYFWVYTQTQLPIEVVYPNSSSRLEHNKTYKALYINNLPDSINCRIYKGGAYVDDIVLNTSNTGCYEFTVLPAWGTGTDYRILIETVDGAAVDYSEYFEITEPLFIDVTYPTSSSVLKIGSQMTIEWLDNISEKVMIILYPPNTSPIVVVDSTESDGRHVWIIPSHLPQGTNYRFRVFSVRDGNITDYSDGFELANTIPIEVTSPNNGTTALSTNTTTQVNWTSQNSVTGNLTLELLSKGVSQGIVATNVPNTGTHPWTIPNTVISGSEYQIKATDDNNAMVYDRSDDFTISNALPVELVKFEAVKRGTTALLTWSTASEENNSHFEIERSKDGANFEKIGDVQGNGNTQTLTEYEFTDETPQSGHNYYRLKQVDFDDSYSYSLMRVVTMSDEKKNIVNIFPNPSNGQFTLQVAKIGDYNIKVITLAGQIIHNETLSGNEKTINLSRLPKGLYFIQLQNQGSKEVITEEIVIQ